MTIAQSLDHFVVPVDDLVSAEEFYVRVFDESKTATVARQRNAIKAKVELIWTIPRVTSSNSLPTGWSSRKRIAD
jgi:hypothetical protein